MKVDKLLEKEPFKLKQEEKEKPFLEAMQESMKWHYGNCPEFKKFVDSQDFNIESTYKLEDMPFLPVSIFKEMELITGPKEKIKNTIFSSATNSGKPSKIALDKITMKRQQIALKKILSTFLGNERRQFIVLDTKETVQKNGSSISSRASAIRGMAQFAKSMHFVLNDKLEFEPKLFKQAVEEIGKNEKICFFGFTWLVYKTYLAIKENKRHLQEFEKVLQKLGKGRKVLHIGGWKKLKDMAVEKKQFNSKIGKFFKAEDTIDFYGMTEQLGTVYADCSQGYKHAPLYSEIIIRNPETFESAGVGQPGLIQLLTPIPNSYPGISILSEDIGELLGIDDCKCGRKGKYFVFRKRLEKAPIKGCGDTL